MPKFTLPIFVFNQFDEALAVNTVHSLLFYENVYGEEAIARENEFMKEFDPDREPFKAEDYPIKIYINSPGGVVSDLMSIIDTMDSIEKPVGTYCLGMAASCAAVLLSNGKKGQRFIGKNSRVLLHQITAGAFGHIADLEIRLKEVKRINEELVSLIARNTGKSKKDVKADIDRDLWLNAKEAVDYGLVDKIIEKDSNEVKGINVDGILKKDFNVGQTIETKLMAALPERKEVKFELKAMSEDDTFHYFEGHASVFGNTDDDEDIVHKGAFARTLKNYNLLDESNERPVLWQHDVDQPIGKAALIEDQFGLSFKAKMPKEDTFVSGRVMPQLRVGSIRTMSFGFRVVERYFKNGKRNITDVELYEISPVTIPSNSSARITAVKKTVKFQDYPLADESQEWDAKAARKRVREFLDSDDKPSDEYKKAFVWFDEKNAEKFGSYLLPIVDVVNGQLHAIPRALEVVANSLESDRNDLGIPKKDIPSVISHVEKYFEKMGKDSPFDSKSNQNLLSKGNFDTITSVSRFLKEHNLSKSETDNVIFSIKQLQKPCKEAEPCNEEPESDEVVAQLKENIRKLQDLTKRG